jgi:hypothetical protein
MNIGEIRQSIENLAYIRGANNLRDASDAKVAFVEKLLWQELVSVMTEAIKAAPEPEKEPAALKQQEPEPEVPEDPEEQITGEILVADRVECHKCQYYLSLYENKVCQYILKTGRSRGCSVAECEHWKDQKKKRKYQHICKRCGARFTDNSTRTKYCPKCAKEFEDAENSDLGQE